MLCSHYCFELKLHCSCSCFLTNLAAILLVNNDKVNIWRIEIFRSTLVWKYVLRTQMRLYEIAGEGIVGPEFTKALETLAKLREHDRCFCKTELDFVGFRIFINFNDLFWIV